MRRLLPVALLGIMASSLPGFVPAPVDPKLTPGQVVAGKPDKDGIVTMLRPIVMRRLC